ncbi:MAG TPA: glycerophosphodiester phosphodiesterase [Longimicrobiaceae bacterium]|nr:glycerophosphodiester phosphodiesterase [Longimicrobiaceae bacterium]
MRNPFPHPLILGHRGVPAEQVENTLQSFARAMERGADGVELDVRLSRDGVPVVIHDATMERTMGVKGAVAELHWPAIAQLSTARVPSLEQAAAWAAAAGAWLNVELKEPGAEAATLRVLEETGVLGRTFLSSFHPEAVAEVGRLAPDSLRFLLLEAWDGEGLETLVKCGAAGVCLHADAAGPLALEVLRNEDLPVVVWTVNDPERARALFDEGVAAVITDDPAALTAR